MSEDFRASANHSFSNKRPDTLSKQRLPDLSRFTSGVERLESEGVRRQSAYGNDRRKTPPSFTAEFVRLLPTAKHITLCRAPPGTVPPGRPLVKHPEGLQNCIGQDIYIKEEPVTPPMGVAQAISSPRDNDEGVVDVKEEPVTPPGLPMDLDDDAIQASVSNHTTTSDEQHQEAGDELLDRLEQTSINDQGPIDDGKEHGTNGNTVLPPHTNNQSRKLVQYELPEGLERPDWDTDLVRRKFGEIEGPIHKLFNYRPYAGGCEEPEEEEVVDYMDYDCSYIGNNGGIHRGRFSNCLRG